SQVDDSHSVKELLVNGRIRFIPLHRRFLPYGPAFREGHWLAVHYVTVHNRLVSGVAGLHDNILDLSGKARVFDELLDELVELLAHMPVPYSHHGVLIKL